MITGIIAEYNPFHSGHKYQIDYIKQNLGANAVIIVMSGCFTQRGEPAIYDKWERAKTALESGADMVIELPALYAVSCAERFAEGGINLLNASGIVDSVCFGCENPDLDILTQIADVYLNEPENFKSKLSEQLALGESYPRAKTAALKCALSDIPESLVSSPNNILAIEYIKQLKCINSSIVPLPILRTGNYLSESLEESYPSAMAIRKGIRSGALPSKGNEVFPDDMFKLILSVLRMSSPEELSNIYDVSEGLESRMKKAAAAAASYDELISMIATKRFTHARIRRILINTLLGITKNTADASPNYLRVIGVRKESKWLLSELSSKASLPVITNLSSVKQDVCAKHEIMASDLYSVFSNMPGDRDFTEPLIII